MTADEIIVWLEVIKRKDDEIEHWKRESDRWNSKWQEKCQELSIALSKRVKP